jgi:hypothetical protein
MTTVTLPDPDFFFFPVQVSVNVLDSERPPTDSVPEGGRAPDHPPDAAHADAFTADQVSVTVPPGDTLPGVALMVTTGLLLFFDFSTPIDVVAFPLAQARPEQTQRTNAATARKCLSEANLAPMCVSPVAVACSTSAKPRPGFRNRPLY